MANPEGLPTIVWDVDDVKAQTRAAIICSANATFGLRLTPGDFTEDFCRMTGQSREVVTDWWLPFCYEEFPRLDPTPGMPEVVAALSPFARHAQLTSRRPMFRAITEAWTLRHYGSDIKDLHMMDTDWDNNPDAHSVTKAGRFATIAGAVCLIDDTLQHAMSVAMSGSWGMHYNEGLRMPIPEDVPPRFLTARTPEEVGEKITSIVLPSLERARI